MKIPKSKIILQKLIEHFIRDTLKLLDLFSIIKKSDWIMNHAWLLLAVVQNENKQRFCKLVKIVKIDNYSRIKYLKVK